MSQDFLTDALMRIRSRNEVCTHLRVNSFPSLYEKILDCIFPCLLITICVMRD